MGKGITKSMYVRTLTKEEYEAVQKKNAKEIKNKRFDSIINEYYTEEKKEIKVLPTKDWESIILDLIGE